MPTPTAVPSLPTASSLSLSFVGKGTGLGELGVGGGLDLAGVQCGKQRRGTGATWGAQGGEGQLALRRVHSGPRLAAVARGNVAGGGFLTVPCM